MSTSRRGFMGAVSAAMTSIALKNGFSAENIVTDDSPESANQYPHVVIKSGGPKRNGCIYDFENGMPMRAANVFDAKTGRKFHQVLYANTGTGEVTYWCNNGVPNENGYVFPGVMINGRRAMFRVTEYVESLCVDLI